MCKSEENSLNCLVRSALSNALESVGVAAILRKLRMDHPGAEVFIPQLCDEKPRACSHFY